MPVYRKHLDEFIESVSEKWTEFKVGDIELHVSPFYGYKGKLVWQPVFDFDGRSSKVDLQRFCENEIDDIYNWYVEETHDGYHLYSYVGYSGFELSDIEKLRARLTHLYSSYTSLDIRSSIRHLPIRRLAKLQVPTSVRTLNEGFESIKDELHFAHVLRQYVVPTKIHEFDRSFFRTLK